LGQKGYNYLLVEVICGCVLNLVVMNHDDVVVDDSVVHVLTKFNEMDVAFKMFDEMLVSTIVFYFKSKYS